MSVTERITDEVQKDAPEHVTALRLSFGETQTEFKDKPVTQGQPTSKHGSKPKPTATAAHSSRQFRIAGKRPPRHISTPYETKTQFHQFRIGASHVSFAYEFPKNAKNELFQERITAQKAQSMLTRNGMYDYDFFTWRTTFIDVTTYNDPGDEEDAPQYMLFTFLYNGEVPTIIVNYNDYIEAYTFNIDTTNDRHLLMPRTIRWGIGKYWDEEHTNFEHGIDDSRHFSLITFRWSD